MVDFTKKEAERAKQDLDEIIKDQNDEQAGKFFTHFNQISLFLDAAKKEAPREDED